MDEEEETDEYTLGAFEGRIFIAREKSDVAIWELVDQAKSEWVEYARITGEPREWLSDHEFFGHDTAENWGLVTCYCDQYLFLYNWSFAYVRADGYVLFDLATKEFIKVDLPHDTIGTGEDEYPEDSEDDEEAEEEGVDWLS